MEHVIQIGISVDDEAIQKAAVAQASRVLAEDFEKVFIERNYYGKPAPGIDARQIIADKVDEYKDIIIERAVEQVVGIIKRSKAYKDAVARIKEEQT